MGGLGQRPRAAVETYFVFHEHRLRGFRYIYVVWFSADTALRLFGRSRHSNFAAARPFCPALVRYRPVEKLQEKDIMNFIKENERSKICVKQFLSVY